MGLCGHLMAGFDFHAYCTRCRDKVKGTDHCVKREDCQFCNILTQEQKSHLATPSYQKKKENMIKKLSKKSQVAPLFIQL